MYESGNKCYASYVCLSTFLISYTQAVATTFQYLVSLVLCGKFQADQQTMDSEKKTFQFQVQKHFN